MAFRRGSVLLVVGWLLATAWIRADGCVVPQASVRNLPDMPSQCALVIHRQGRETLVVESPFRGEGAEFAWIVPVPGRPSAVRPAPANVLRPLAARFQPEVIQADPFLAWGTFWVGLLAVVTLLTGFLCVRECRRRASLVRWLLLFHGLGLIMAILSVPAMLGSRSAGGMSLPGSRPAETWHRVGHYDVTWLQADGGQALQGWLQEHGFAVLPPGGEAAADAYGREGWFFVISRLRASGQTLGELLTPHPLAIEFPAARPVYPMRLTAVSADELQLDLVVVGDRIVSVPGLAIDHADMYRPLPEDTYRRYGGAEFGLILGNDFLLERLWPNCAVTRLSGTISRRQMDHDLQMAAVQESHHRRIMSTFSAAVLLPVLLCSGVVLLFGPPAMILGWNVLLGWGAGVALRRLVLPVVAAVLGCAGICAMTVDLVPEGRLAYHESSEYWAAEASLRNLHSAEVAYAARHPDSGFAPLSRLASENFLDRRFLPGSGHFDGYTFSGEVQPQRFTITARSDGGALEADLTITEDGVVRHLDGTPLDR